MGKGIKINEGIKALNASVAAQLITPWKNQEAEHFVTKKWDEIMKKNIDFSMFQEDGELTQAFFQMCTTIDDYTLETWRLPLKQLAFLMYLPSVTAEEVSAFLPIVLSDITIQDRLEYLVVDTFFTDYVNIIYDPLEREEIYGEACDCDFQPWLQNMMAYQKEALRYVTERSGLLF
ncbi:hypothetical protein [Listeria sp. SHR_NRA_18]|uniref:hypothetical protein n=1 Tax=Listeria sp. SHR_NRA_18 TaxID=2269046 RepID=UPI000F5EE221|nr:hypothetical protein [Listeria sp. SHR_NRA_18]